MQFIFSSWGDLTLLSLVMVQMFLLGFLAGIYTYAKITENRVNDIVIQFRGIKVESKHP